MPGEAGPDELEVDVEVVDGHAADDAPVAIDVDDLDAHHLAEGQIGGHLACAPPEGLATLRAVDAFEPDARVAAVAQNGDRSPSATPTTLPLKESAAAAVASTVKTSSQSDASHSEAK